MAIFEDVSLTWEGKDYRVSRNKIMGLIAAIEERIPFTKLHSSNPPMSGIAQGYAAALRYAGARVSDEDVYASLFSSDGVGISQAISDLSVLMIPPDVIRKKMDASAENDAAAGKKKTRQK